MSLDMLKLRSARLQAMISIIVATLVIIFSYWYFTAKQKEYTGAMKEYMDLAQEKFYSPRWTMTEPKMVLQTKL